MKVIVVGLGKMGMQIVERFLSAEISVAAVDPNEDAVKTATGKGAVGAKDRADAVSKFADEKVVVWLMIPAGIVSSEVDAWLSVLPEGSIVIDGGNTDFRETKKHFQKAKEKGVVFLDVGTSGGILGNENGFSMMVGGDEKAYHEIDPLLKAMSTPRGGYRYFGAPGSGHYVKMVHNAIEYGMMESLTEGYRMLKDGPYDGLDLALAGDVWQEASVIESTLNKLAAEVMHENPELEGANGYVAESGEARWTLEVAKEHGIPMPAIQSAFDVRVESQKGKTHFGTKLLAELRNKFGGHPLNKKG